MGRALLVGKSAELRTAFSDYLQSRGVEAFGARGASDVKALLSALKPDVTAIDLDTQEYDGFQLIEPITASGSSCLIISTRDGVKDRIRALELGAQEYIVKPVDVEELYLRVRNILVHRRPASVGAINPILDVNGVRVDVVTRRLLGPDNAPGEQVTGTELAWLRILTENIDRVVSKDALFKASHSRSYEPSTRSLDVGISRLRLKLKSSNAGVEISSVRQTGYLLSREIRRP